MSFLFWWFAFGSIGHHASGAAETQLTQTRTGMMPWLTLTITKCLELATRRTWAGIRLGNFRKIWKAGSRLRSSRCGPAKIHRDNLDIDCVDWTWLCWLGFISFLFFFSNCVCVSLFRHLNQTQNNLVPMKSMWFWTSYHWTTLCIWVEYPLSVKLEDGVMKKHPHRELEGVMLQERTTWHEVVRDASLQAWCRTRVGNQCIIRVGQRLILNEAYFVIPDAALVRISFDFESDMPDRVSLLQRGVIKKGGDQEEISGGHGHISGEREGSQTACSSQGPRAPDVETAFGGLQRLRAQPSDPMTDTVKQLTYYMYRRTIGYRSAVLDPKDPFDERRQVAQQWAMATEELAGLHPVRARPEDLRKPDSIVLLVRSTEDAELRSFPNDALVLFDMEIHSGRESEPGPKLFRHVDWLRASMTREGLLAHLRVNDFCRLVARHRCLVWLNNVLWHHQDQEEKTIRMGDYVRVAVPAPQGQSLAAARRFLQTTEDQARDHIMFESSASYPESDEGVEEDQAESGSTLYGAPDSTSEPEPHATCQLQGHGKLEALVTACNAVGTGDVDLALHCLAGRYIGVRKINVQRPVTSGRHSHGN